MLLTTWRLIEFKILPQITSSSQSSKILLDRYFQRIPNETGCGLSPFPWNKTTRRKKKALQHLEVPQYFQSEAGLNSHLEASFKNEKQRDLERTSKFSDPVKSGDQLILKHFVYFIPIPTAVEHENFTLSLECCHVHFLNQCLWGSLEENSAEHYLSPSWEKPS